MLQQFDKRNRNLIVNVAGELLPRDQARLSPFDAGSQSGDAVWEGLRLYAGRIFRLHHHLARLRAGAAALAYEQVPEEAWIVEQIRRTLEANGMQDGVHIRLTLTRGERYTSGMDPRLCTTGCTLIVLGEHKMPVYERDGIRLITAATRRIPPECLDQKIHSCNQLNSILAKLEAIRAGADEALMLDTRGFVAETNATNVFLVKDDTLATPTAYACPEGITRGAVLELCAAHHIPCAVRDIQPEELLQADELFCTGTLGEIVPVIQLDGQEVGGGKAGKWTQQIAHHFRALVAKEGDVVVRGA